jgi:hypothetical protein
MRDALAGRPLTWLAEQTGDDYKNLQRWVNGKTEFSVDFVARFCEAVDVAPGWVLGMEPEKRPVDPTVAQEALRRIGAEVDRARAGTIGKEHLVPARHPSAGEPLA